MWVKEQNNFIKNSQFISLQFHYSFLVKTQTKQASFIKFKKSQVCYPIFKKFISLVNIVLKF